jgi:lipopolysaccharide biosynthesis protein
MFARFLQVLSALNRGRKEAKPSRYVRRRRFEVLASKYQCLVEAISSAENNLIKPAEIQCIQPLGFEADVQEVCLFVSYAPLALIKPHVRHHINSLSGAGIAVALVINVDDVQADLSSLNVEGLKLSGLYVRENKGFDFGAWGHLYSMMPAGLGLNRLYLVNDSMIGPLTAPMFDKLMLKIKSSTADMLGLIGNAKPVFHLQSFFLVFNQSVLIDERFQSFFKTLWSLPTKEMVIDFYEVRLTQLIKNLGYVAEPMYSIDTDQYQKTDAVIHRLDELLAIDFPYVKTSMAHRPQGQKILNLLGWSSHEASPSKPSAPKAPSY